MLITDFCPMSLDIDKLLECSLAAARAAATYAMDHYNRRSEVVEMSSHDVKLKLDQECQEKAIAVIRSQFPEHSIIAEEQTSGIRTRPDSETEWIVDPIDGTVNFFHGLPLWCSSVAARHHGAVVAATVYAPALNVCYMAAADGQSVCNGLPIHVSSVASLSDAIVLTGIVRNVSERRSLTRMLAELAGKVQRLRILGSAALDICAVAHGQADGYFESGIYVWDVAAAGLIVRQAGGSTELIGEPLSEGRIQFLATNGHIHDAVKNVFRQIRNL